MPVQNLSDLSEKEFSAFVKSFDTVISDCDGINNVNLYKTTYKLSP